MMADVVPLPRPLDLGQRLRAGIALALAAGAFCTVGWLAMHRPEDPAGPISLVLHSQRYQALFVGIALAAVVSAVGEILVGAHLARFGVFAAGFGFVTLSLRGGNMTDLLVLYSARAGESRASIYGALAVESVVWSLMLAVSFLASVGVLRWLRNGQESNADAGATDRPRVDGVRSGAEGPSGRATWMGPIHQGIPALITTGAAALVVIRVAAAGSPAELVRTGQVLFSVGLAFLAGTWLSMRLFPRATFVWTLLAVPVVAVVGYLLAGAGTGFADALEPYNRVAAVPASPFARALPIEQIAVGTLATFLARWLGTGPMTSGLEDPG